MECFGKYYTVYPKFAFSAYVLQPHLCAWEDHGTDPPRSYAKAHGGQGGDLRQPPRASPA